MFIHQDGSIKYCPKIISPLRNYEMDPKAGTAFKEQHFQDKVNKKVLAFIEDIEFILSLLMSKILPQDGSAASTPTIQNQGSHTLMLKLRRYFKSLKHRQFGSTSSQFTELKHFCQKVL